MTERHVVITGISGGVGRHLAMRAMQEGYAVTGLCRTPPADLPCETLACDVAMADQVADFVGDCPLAAHNAAFDTRFWDAELARVARQRRQEFACSLLLARRLLPDAPSHKLGALVAFAGLPVAGRSHRALADAEMAASLLLRLEGELRTRHGVGEVSHALLRKIQAAPKTQLERCLAAHRETAGA